MRYRPEGCSECSRERGEVVSAMVNEITNRQRKCLSFFGVDPSWLSKGQASTVIGALFEDPENVRRWSRYVHHTNDVGRDSGELLPYEEASAPDPPQEWSRRDAVESADAAAAQGLLDRDALFNDPGARIRPEPGQVFVLTGKFTQPKREVATAIEALGGIVDKEMSSRADVVVLGTHGNAQFKHGAFGTKIRKATTLRNQTGGRRPSIRRECDLDLSLQPK